MAIMKFKTHRGLVPLFGIIAAGCVMCAASCIRTLMKDPDIIINRRGNPEPWELLRSEQFKYHRVEGDEPVCQAPKYWEK